MWSVWFMIHLHWINFDWIKSILLPIICCMRKKILIEFEFCAISVRIFLPYQLHGGIKFRSCSARNKPSSFLKLFYREFAIFRIFDYNKKSNSSSLISWGPLYFNTQQFKIKCRTLICTESIQKFIQAVVTRERENCRQNGGRDCVWEAPIYM